MWTGNIIICPGQQHFMQLLVIYRKNAVFSMFLQQKNHRKTYKTPLLGNLEWYHKQRRFVNVFMQLPWEFYKITGKFLSGCFCTFASTAGSLQSKSRHLCFTLYVLLISIVTSLHILQQQFFFHVVSNWFKNEFPILLEKTHFQLYGVQYNRLNLPGFLYVTRVQFCRFCKYIPFLHCLLSKDFLLFL